MPRKRHKAEEIVTKLRQVDVLVSQGQGIADAIRQIGVSEVTYYRWRQGFGGLKTEQVKRLKDLETENNRLRRAYCISHHYRRYSWMRVVRSPARPCWSIDDCHERNSSTVSI